MKKISLLSRIFVIISIILISVSCVLTVDSNNQNAVSGINANIQTPPQSPTDITILAVSAIDAQIGWTAPEDMGSSNDIAAQITGYELQYSQDVEFISVQTFYVDDPTYKIVGLKPNSEYYLRVRAINNNSINRLSDFAVVNTKEKGKFSTTTISPLGVLKDFKVEAQSYTATVSWQSPTSIGFTTDGKPAKIKYYVVKYFEDENHSKPVGSPILINNNTITLRRLLPAKKYYVLVRFVNSIGDESENTETTFQTESRSKEPAKPSNLKVIRNIGDGKIDISWSKPDAGKVDDGLNDAKIKSYVIRYDTKSDFSGEIKKEVLSTNRSVEQYKFTGLTGDTNYYIDVTAINSVGKFSQASDILQVKVLAYAIPPAKAGIIEVKQGSDATQTTVSWTTPQQSGTQSDGKTKADIDHYVVDYSLDNQFPSGGATLSTLDIDATTNIVNLQDLIGQETYYVRVRAINTAEEQSISDTVTYQVPSRAEPSSSIVILSHIYDDSTDILKVYWSMPAEAGFEADGTKEAEITSYIVYYSETQRFDINSAISKTITTRDTDDNVVTETSISNLKGNITYYFRVLAVNSGGKTSVSTSDTSIDIPPNINPPAKIETLSVKGSSANRQFTITWNTSDDKGTEADGITQASLETYNYQIVADPADIGDASKIIYSSSYRATQVSPYTYDYSDDSAAVGLHGGQTYYLRLSVTNSVSVASEYSDFVSFTVVDLSTSPSEVIGNMVIGQPMRASKTATINWSVPNNSGLNTDGVAYDSPDIKYQIQYTWVENSAETPNYNDDTRTVSNEISKAVTTLQIDNLRGDTTYYYKIFAINPNSMKSISNAVEGSFTTGSQDMQPQSPTNPLIVYDDITNNYQISWEAAPPGIKNTGEVDRITKYTLRYSEDDLDLINNTQRGIYYRIKEVDIPQGNVITSWTENTINIPSGITIYYIITARNSSGFEQSTNILKN